MRKSKKELLIREEAIRTREGELRQREAELDTREKDLEEERKAVESDKAQAQAKSQAEEVDHLDLIVLEEYEPLVISFYIVLTFLIIGLVLALPSVWPFLLFSAASLIYVARIQGAADQKHEALYAVRALLYLIAASTQIYTALAAGAYVFFEAFYTTVFGRPEEYALGLDLFSSVPYLLPILVLFGFFLLFLATRNLTRAVWISPFAAQVIRSSVLLVLGISLVAAVLVILPFALAVV